MSACNARPPEGHPLHGTLVACHFSEGHKDWGMPHAWEIDPAERGILRLAGLFADKQIVSVDWQIPHPLEVWSTDEEGNKLGTRPYRRWTAEMEGPWVLVRFEDGEEWAIWKATGSAYRVGADGAVEEDALFEETHRERLKRLLDKIESERPTFTCPRCHMTSGHPTDVKEGYCGNCHDWTGSRD